MSGSPRRCCHACFLLVFCLFIWVVCLCFGTGSICSLSQHGTHHVDRPSWPRTHRELPSVGRTGVAPCLDAFFTIDFYCEMILRSIKCYSREFPLLLSSRLPQPAYPSKKVLSHSTLSKPRHLKHINVGTGGIWLQLNFTFSMH